ncbi:MAG: HAD family hydrolase [Nitrospiraceae bacterium]|nr:HAD family hydrolase [Nitrospiraceae bacterium]
MVLVFDLDDTLYDELSFVRSGFKAVAGYLAENYRLPGEKLFSFMLCRLKIKRQFIFDDTLREFGIFTRRNVQKCVSIYRGHKPDIRLYPEADRFLKSFKDLPKYIVTDGNKLVQQNKLDALRLGGRVDYCYLTYRYGLKRAKPSPYCFFKVCERERVEPTGVIYIADNPNKDFVGIKPHGFKTLRVRKGQFHEIRKTDEFEADFQIDSLRDLTLPLLRKIFGNRETAK